MASERSQNVNVNPPQSELRLVLLGRIGAGKSTVVKTILGQDKFRSEGATCVKKQGEVAGRKVTIVDTPGWDSVKHTSMHIQQEIKNSVTLCPPGPHALLLVVPMGNQLSSSDRKAIKYCIELLSVRAWKYTMVLFVSEAEEKLTYDEQNQMAERANSILVKCGERHHYFQCGDSTTQVTRLLKKIDAMAAENVEDFFIPQVYHELLESRTPKEVSRMYKDRESRLEQRYKRELKERDEQLRTYREAEKSPEMMRRRESSLLLPPHMNAETQDGTGMQKGSTDQQTVDLQAIKQGYREEALSVVQHYVKPLMVIMTSVLGALVGAVAGAQHGTLGSCVGIAVGVLVSVLGCYAVRGAATAARDVPIQVNVKGTASHSSGEGKTFFIDSPSVFNKDQ